MRVMRRATLRYFSRVECRALICQSERSASASAPAMRCAATDMRYHGMLLDFLPSCCLVDAPPPYARALRARRGAGTLVVFALCARAAPFMPCQPLPCRCCRCQARCAPRRAAMLEALMRCYAARGAIQRHAGAPVYLPTCALRRSHLSPFRRRICCRC